MANPFIGQISMFGFPFAPAYWAFCDGSVLPVNQYSTLFSLIGTTFGGDGTRTVGLPNLVKSSPCGTGTGPGLSARYLGELFGTATVTLDENTMAPHNHAANANAFYRGADPVALPRVDAALYNSTDVEAYSDGVASTVMAQTVVTPAGLGQPHNNQQPYLALNFCIALQGEYPDFG